MSLRLLGISQLEFINYYFSLLFHLKTLFIPTAAKLDKVVIVNTEVAHFRNCTCCMFSESAHLLLLLLFSIQVVQTTSCTPGRAAVPSSTAWTTPRSSAPLAMPSHCSVTSVSLQINAYIQICLDVRTATQQLKVQELGSRILIRTHISGLNHETLGDQNKLTKGVCLNMGMLYSYR